MQNGPEQRWPPEAERRLREVGWHPGRSLSTADWEHVLREQGHFAIHPAAQQFLAEFGGLTLTRVFEGSIAPVSAETFFDPTLAKWDQEIFEDLSEGAGAEPYSIGMKNNRNAYLGMTTTGAVYYGMDDAFLLAETGDEAVEKIFGGEA
ncbi:SUKH-3 domain-containing protein [Streptomyces boninensis]|uniref:SUKH-3 domain-containing protein n=1 Tax=Streptomyces boninensis TaxID=2039455 RepID=UPI003B2242CF